MLWDLVWAGRITNDTFGPLRTLGTRGGARGGHAAASRSGRGGWRGVVAGGRWSRVDQLMGAFGGLNDAAPTPTERALARANVLLAR